MEKQERQKIWPAVSFMVLMAALGASDSLRGIFAPAFQLQFGLNSVGVSNIMVASYAGNLIFLCLGGRVLDRYNRKAVMMAVIGLWISALALYLLTDHYLLLLAGMFVAMGASTLLNTAVNIMTPFLFAASPGMMVNLFFFIQGIGTSASQNVAGRYAQSYGVFRLTCLLLAVMGMISLLLLWNVHIPGQEDQNAGDSQSSSFRSVIMHKGFCLLVLMFGLYFIGEHGIMNWLVSYGSEGLGLSTSKAALYLSGFYGGMTVGRLLFSPVVSRIGAFRSVLFFGGMGTVLFILGLLSGGKALWLLSCSGLALSILYPTMVFMIRYIYPQNMLATALGLIISAATLFDIGFNMLFGMMVDAAGFRISFISIPLCMAGFFATYLVFWSGYSRRECGDEKASI